MEAADPMLARIGQGFACRRETGRGDWTLLRLAVIGTVRAGA